MKKWKCSVCGYVHEGEEPPDKCPVCGADKSKFNEYTPPEEEENGDEAESIPEAPNHTPAWKVAGKKHLSGIHDVLADLIVRHHLHPISVHVPNGVLPASVLFMALAMALQFLNLDKAAFYNLVFVVLTMPVVLFTGYTEWKKKYGGNVTTLFFTKMICGFSVFVLSVILVFWRIIDPDVVISDSSARIPFLLLHLLLLGLAGIAGHLGGKLVFDKE